MSTLLSLKVKVVKSTKMLSDADIICTATTASSPLFSHEDLKPGVHINAIGAYRPDMREIPFETVQRAKIVVDHRASCLTEAGDLIQPLQAGLIDEKHIYAEIGEIVAGTKLGRESDEEITLFTSVGNAVQDLAAASRVLANAEKQGLGREVNV
jgi:ornithine cyclodeaminase/alanine dehydrogenase-like protein (mu-crystallin family)